MQSERERNLTILYPVMKTAVILLVAKWLYSLVSDPGFEISFWNGFVQVVAVLGLLILSVVIFALSRSNFNVVGFFLVMLVAMIQILTIFLNTTGEALLRLPENFLLIAVSFYFIAAAGRGSRHGR